jgi:hypothetical protein
MGRRGHPGPERPHRSRHRGERRHRLRDRAPAGRPRRARGPRRARSSARLAQVGVSNLATHPGAARTGLVSGKKAAWGRRPRGAEILVRTAQLLFAQPASLAALPALYQATDPAARGDCYVGTRCHMSGYPAVNAFPPAALSRPAPPAYGGYRKS